MPGSTGFDSFRRRQIKRYLFFTGIRPPRNGDSAFKKIIMNEKDKEEIIQHIADVACFQINTLVDRFGEKYARQEMLEEIINELKKRV